MTHPRQPRLAALWIAAFAVPALPALGQDPFVAMPEGAFEQEMATDVTGTGTASDEVAPFVVAQATTVDETALRYFARQGDTRRVEAEIARLRTLYPDWEPPANLLANDYTPDPLIERIWELYAEGDYAGARAAIADKQAQDPDWAPTDDMLRSLRLGEAAVRLRNASNAAQYNAVISIAANEPDLLTCANIDLLWRLAEAFIETDAPQRGLDAYTYILNNCEDAQERFATIQQASERLESEALTGLLALERLGEDGAGEFEALRLDLARNAIVAVLAGRDTAAPADDIHRLEAATEGNGQAEDLRLLGWYALNQNRPEDALGWFEQAMDADPSALSVNGLGVALIALDRPAEAESALVPYVDESEDLTALYLSAAAALLAETPRIALEPPVLDRIVRIAFANAHVPTAQELGWYAYDFDQPQTAIVWFDVALGWDAEDEPSAYGIVVASDRVGDAARVRDVQRLWSARSERIATFGTDADEAPAPPAPPATVQAPTATPAQPRPRPAAAPQPVSAPAPREAAAPVSITVTYQGCASYVPAASLAPNQALSRGWCLLDLQRPAEAVESFGRALQSPAGATRTDAAYGQALAYVRLGLAEHASVAAAAAPQSRARIVELQTAILTLTALSSYQAGDYRRTLTALDERARYAAEQNDLLTLRAWSYYHLGRHIEAERIFSAVAATGYRDAASGLSAVRAVRQQQQP